MGCLEILNVQGGEVKITFDTNDAPEAIRARRIIGQMIQSGFVLLVEVERNNDKRYERALGFDANTGEYIIADFVPGEPVPEAEPPVEAANPPASNGNGKPRGRPRKRLPMEDTNATAVGRSAGG
jgi:hypothetical protein